MQVQASYAKLRSGAWGVRVNSAAVRKGEVVTVTKRDGTSKTEKIAAIVWAGNGVSLCAIAAGSAGSKDSRGYSIRSGASYRAGVTAPNGRTCPICGSRECARAWNPNGLCDDD